MPIITTAGLSDSVRAQYEADYVEGIASVRLYDQLASPVGADMATVKRGSSVVVPFISKLAPSTQTMSETDDLVPQSYADTTVTVTPTSRGNAVKWSEKVELITYTNDVGAKIGNLGENMQESIDLLAQAAALTGSHYYSYVARASLDAGTAAHNVSRASFINAQANLQQLRVPGFENGGKYVALFNPYILPDILADTSIIAVGQYQQPGIVLNGEIGTNLMGFRLVAHPDAKVFWGAGADNATNIATTLNGATEEMATTITVTSGTSIAVGMRLNIGTEETGSTHYATNETCKVVSVSTNDIGVVGSGPNGGLRYAHASGTAVRNADSVVPVVFGGPMSLGKVYDTEIGEFGQLVGPKKVGLADQWTTMAWKYYGGYGIVAQNRIFRMEFSSTMDK